MEQATFAMGCFWGPQLKFDQVEGVIKTLVGFMGGDKDNPTYKEVCADTTGHAEVVHIEFDPSIVSYEDLLDIFWNDHDPTQVNKQGPDHGSQYRSAIFYYTDEQKELAEKTKKEQQERYNKPIATQIVSAQTFYPAEEYHQKYLEKRGHKTCG